MAESNVSPTQAEGTAAAVVPALPPAAVTAAPGSPPLETAGAEASPPCTPSPQGKDGQTTESQPQSASKAPKPADTAKQPPKSAYTLWVRENRQRVAEEK